MKLRIAKAPKGENARRAFFAAKGQNWNFSAFFDVFEGRTAGRTRAELGQNWPKGQN
jgi:hypothetical protein